MPKLCRIAPYAAAGLVICDKGEVFRIEARSASVCYWETPFKYVFTTVLT
jgi:hypothetical protein